MTETMMDAWYCQECGQLKPGRDVPDDRSAILEFATAIGLVDAAGKPTSVGKALVLDFYGSLLLAAPGLVPRFPEDLLDASAALDGAGAQQRDRLLQAILAVATLFDPGNPKRMDQLDAALEHMARRHVRHSATLEEYGAVTSVLLGVFRKYAATAGVPEPSWLIGYEPALRRALTYTSGRMMAFESLAAAVHSTEPVMEAVTEQLALQDAHADQD